MTGAWSLAALLSLILLLTGWISKNGALLAMALPYLVFTLWPLWRNLPRPDWEAERELQPNHLLGGEPCQVRVLLTSRGEPPEEVHIADTVPEGVKVEGRSDYHGEIKAGRMEVFQYSIRGVRGRYEFPSIKASWGDLLGLKQKEEFLPCSQSLAVIPATEKLGKIKISPRRTRVFSGAIRSRESGAGVEFFGTRPYVPGDPLRYLNWRAGARWDLLVTNLFEQERIADVGIILDARRVADLGTAQDSLFEHSIRGAASLADYFLEEGNRVGLLIYGRFIEWTFPGYGKQQRARIMSALAGAQLSDHAVFKEFKNLPTWLFPAESQIILVSPLSYEDVVPLRYLRALGYRVLIVSPDPIAYEQRLTPRDRIWELAGDMARMERNIILAKLRRHGVQVMEWDVFTPLRIAANQSWKGFQR